MIDEMSSISNELVPLEDEAMKNVQAGRLAEALDYVYGNDYSTSIGKINSLKEQFLETLASRTQAQVKSLSVQVGTIRVVLIIALFLVGIMQLLIMRVTRKKILSPVISVRDQMKEISCGNLFHLIPHRNQIGRASCRERV